MELNSQFNAQFPDVEETMNKPMDDEKLVGIAFDSGLRFTDSESRESYRRFASFIIANAESEHRDALAAKDAKHKAQVENLLDILKQEQAWNLAKTQKIAKLNEVIAGLVPLADHADDCVWFHHALCGGPCDCGLDSLLAAAAPFLPQTKYKKEK